VIIPSTTVSVLRGNESSPAVDGYGDPVDVDAVAASGLPAYLEVGTQRQYDPETGMTTTLDGFRVLLRPRVFDFNPTDRIVDERTQLTYQVETVGTTQGFMNQNIRLFCTRVS
jgi:hypothetical protein